MRDKFKAMVQDQRGIAAILVVIFAAILMAVVSISFVMIMLRNQQQATSTELSQTAYDAAMTGVEDGKRAILQCLQNPTGPGCSGATGLGSQNCQTLAPILSQSWAQPPGDASGDLEYPIQRAEGVLSNTLNQAYTCVTVNNVPNTYKAVVSNDTSFVLPLNTSSNAPTMTFSWQASPDRVFSQLPSISTNFLNTSTWTGTQQYPPVMRLELIKGVSNADLSTSGSTLFIYPTSLASPPADFALDNHTATGTTPNKPVPAYCPTGSDTCTVTLQNTAGNVAQSGYYLVMTPIYGDAAVSLTLPAGNNFTGLQDVIDSTGRANDLYRRVQARVDLIPHPVYPNAALGLTGPLCKSFIVTPSSYLGGATTYSSAACQSN